MKKLILILLVSIVVSQTNICKVYEVYDEEKKQCIQVCEQDEFFNEILMECDICKEGEIYKRETKKCESICPKNEFYNTTSKQCEKMPIKCVNGEAVDGKCKCPDGKLL